MRIARLLCAFFVSVFVAACSGSHAVVPAPAADSGSSTDASSVSAVRGDESTQTSAAATIRAETPTMADAFVDSIGVNIHLGDMSSWYGKNFDGILFLMNSLGARHYRDGGNIGYADILAQYRQLAADGHKIMLGTSVGDSLSSLAAWEKSIGTSNIDAVEGPSEYDIAGVKDWATALDAFQSELYPSVKSVLDVPVIAPALVFQSSMATEGALHPPADFANMHDYFGGFNPGSSGWGPTDSFGTYGSLAWNIALADQTAEGKPIYSTETGYSDADDPNPVSAAVKARYTIRTLLEHWNAKVARTYLYELIDQGPTPFSHYGLADSNGNAKPAFRAIKRMITHLSDPGGAFTVSPLTYSLAGSVSHTLLQRRNGTYVLIVWVEAYEWNVNTDVPVSVAPRTVSLGFSKAPRTMSATTFGPTGEVVTSSVVPSTNVSLHVTGYPTMIDITP